MFLSLHNSVKQNLRGASHPQTSTSFCWIQIRENWVKLGPTGSGQAVLWQWLDHWVYEPVSGRYYTLFNKSLHFGNISPIWEAANVTGKKYIMNRFIVSFLFHFDLLWGWWVSIHTIFVVFFFFAIASAYFVIFFNPLIKQNTRTLVTCILFFLFFPPAALLVMRSPVVIVWEVEENLDGSQVHHSDTWRQPFPLQFSFPHKNAQKSLQLLQSCCSL